MKKSLSFILSMIVFLNLAIATPVFATTSPYIKSDTPSNFSLQEGASYTFRFTIIGSVKGSPTFSTGNGSVLSITSVSHSGNDYYVKVHSEGYVDQSTGVYSKLPGQSSVRQAVIKIVPANYSYQKIYTWYCRHKDIGHINKINVQQWVGNYMYTALWGLDEFSGADVSVTSSNENVVAVSVGRDSSKSSSVNVQATTQDVYDEAFSHIRSTIGEGPLDGLADDNFFKATAVGAGTATITVTIKSPSTSASYVMTEDWNVLDPSKFPVTSDTASEISLAKNQSYTFKLTFPQGIESYGIDFYAKGNVYCIEDGKEVTEESFAKSVVPGIEWDSGLQTEGKSLGNGVYNITVSAVPESNGLKGYIKSGDTFSLMCAPYGV